MNKFEIEIKKAILKTMNVEVPTNILDTIQDDEEAGVDMKKVVGKADILFLCLDGLRYDVAREEELKNGTPHLNQYGPWIESHAAGNFTYPSHHAMFSGFLPVPVSHKSMVVRQRLFFPKGAGLGKIAPKHAYSYDAPNFVEGLSGEGYETICIGGVAFFDKRTKIGSVFPNMFRQSFWHTSLGCMVKDSTKNQVTKAIREIEKLPDESRYFMYINVSAIHYPNYFYLDGCKEDNLESHGAALRYVDGELRSLFDFCKKRNPTFVIVCSDHGTCYGEDGVIFHGINHEIINTVPYKHFFL
jgi:hypothetical protein